jgi:alpha-D-xyloside xylohydrolase
MMKPITILLILVLTPAVQAALLIDEETNTVRFRQPASMEFRVRKDPFSLEVLAPDGKTVVLTSNGRDSMFSFFSVANKGAVARLLSWTVSEDRVNLAAETEIPQMTAFLTLDFSDVDAPEVHLSIREGGKAAGVDRVVLIVRLEGDEHLFGLGTPETGGLDRRGQVVEMWNKAGVRRGDTLVPVFLSTRGYGMYMEHSGRGVFDFGASAPDSTVIIYPGADLKFRLFWGPEFESVISYYTRLTGRPPLPAPWHLRPVRSLPPANATGEVILADISNLERNRISAGSAVLGPQWMTSRMSWEFDPRGFPEPKNFVRKLHDNGCAVTLWVAPYDGSVSPRYEEGLDNGYYVKRPDGSVWSETREERNYLDGSLYGSDRSLVDFTNPGAVAWWSARIRSMTALGIDGFLLSESGDIPRYSVFHNGETGETLQNRFALYYSRTFYESLIDEPSRRPLLISRAGCPGSQSFAHFLAPTGYETTLDPQKGLPAFLRSALSAGLSGFPLWMTEIGTPSGKIRERVLARWVEAAAFCPGIVLTASPWEYGEETTGIFRKYLGIHESLGPYLQSYASAAHEKGVPLLRPLVYHHRLDPQAASCNNQFYLGDHLMVAPVVTNEEARQVYFPDGVYERVFGPAARFSGPKSLTLQAPLDQCPVFLRQGAIVPLIPSGDFPESWGSAFEGSLVWFLFPQGRSTFRYFDGTRRWVAEVREVSTSDDRVIEIELPESAEPVGVVVFGRPVPSRIVADGVEIRRVNYPAELKLHESSAWTQTGEGRTLVRLVPPIPSLVIVEE